MVSIRMVTLATPAEPWPLDRDVYTKNAQWGPPVVPATRLSAPSSSSSTTSSSSLTLYEDEDGWYDFAKADDVSLASDSTDATPPSPPSIPLQPLPLTHGEWLHQFAEQARRAHMRNVARTMGVDPCLPTIVAYPETEYQKPEPALLQVKQPWLTPFRRGCVTADPKARRVHAQNVVAEGEWDADGLLELANKVGGHTAEGYTEEFALLAPFAHEIADCLAEGVGTVKAELFKELLTECLLAEFAVWWDMVSSWPLARASCHANITFAKDLPTSVGKLRYESLWDVTRFYDNAFALATFIGQAFRECLLPVQAVHQCLALLVRKLSIIEQVQAVHAIILHADAALCDARSLPILMRVFKFRAVRLPPGTSVLWEPYTREQVGAYVAVSAVSPHAHRDITHATQDIAAILSAWEKAGPSHEYQCKLERAKRDKAALVAHSPSKFAFRYSQGAESADDVMPTNLGWQARLVQQGPPLYSDAVKKRNKT